MIPYKKKTADKDYQKIYLFVPKANWTMNK